MTDKPVVNTPGEMLRRARRDAGLELDQVSERTKIPSAVLRSLELDEYHKISGALYVNSFLRTYADDVGLDPVLVLDAYQRFSGEVVPAVAGQDTETVWVEEEVQIRHVGLPWGRIGLAVAAGLALILTGVWLFTLRETDNVRPAAFTENGETVVDPPVESTAAGGEAYDAPAPATDGDAVGTPEESGSRPVEQPSSVSPQPTPSADLRAAIPGTPAVPFSGGERPVVLRLLSRDPVGVRVACDNERNYTEVDWPPVVDVEPLPQEGIRAGRPYRTRDGLVVYWGARDQFSMKLDRTSDVDITLNGVRRDIRNLRPGQEQILYLPGER